MTTEEASGGGERQRRCTVKLSGKQIGRRTAFWILYLRETERNDDEHFYVPQSFLFLFGGSMREEYLVITNNPMAFEKLSRDRDVVYKDVSFEEILVEARNRIHSGAKLLSHPLSGSVKPGETPYKSLLLTKAKGKVDFDSLALIEKAIEACGKFQNKTALYGEGVLKDFQIVDLTLVESAIASAE